MYLSDVCTIPSNLSGHPADQRAVGPRRALPIGVQVLAPALAEALMFRVARAIEAAAQPGARRRPEAGACRRSEPHEHRRPRGSP